MLLAENQYYGWITILLVGSLLEAAYLFRWFSYARTVNKENEEVQIEPVASFWQSLPIGLVSALLLATGYLIALNMNVAANELFLPLLIGLELWLIDSLPGRFKNMVIKVF